MSDFLPGVKEPKNKKCDGAQISKKKSQKDPKGPRNEAKNEAQEF